MTSPTDLPGTPELPSAVDLDRLTAAVGTQSWTMTAVGPQTLRGRWDDAEIDVTIPQSEGVVVLLRGRRLAAMPAAQAAALEEFVLQWHRQRVWPSLFVQPDDAGDLVLHAHMGIDATEGLTDGQLVDSLRVGVGTIQQAFAELTRVLASAAAGPGASGPGDGAGTSEETESGGDPDEGPASDAPERG